MQYQCVPELCATNAGAFVRAIWNSSFLDERDRSRPGDRRPAASRLSPSRVFVSNDDGPPGLTSCLTRLAGGWHRRGGWTLAQIR